MKTTKEDIEDLKVAAEMQDLLNSPGWKLYAKILQGHIDQKTSAMLQPYLPGGMVEDGVAHVLVAEASKGAILGLRLALSLPSGIVAGADAIRKSLNPSDTEVGP